MNVAIYKMPFVVGMWYSGIGADGEMDCKHISFHWALMEQRQAWIWLLLMMFCPSDTGYYPLQQQLAM